MVQEPEYVRSLATSPELTARCPTVKLEAEHGLGFRANVLSDYLVERVTSTFHAKLVLLYNLGGG